MCLQWEGFLSALVQFTTTLSELEVPNIDSLIL